MHFFSPEITFALPSRRTTSCCSASTTAPASSGWSATPGAGRSTRRWACGCASDAWLAAGGGRGYGRAPPRRPSLRHLVKTESPMSRPLLPGVAAMAVIVVASNVLVQFLVGDWLTWGAFTYPFAFLVTDLMNRLHGPGAARRVVVAGFVVGLVCSSSAARSRGRSGRWSACGWRSGRGRRSSSASSSTSRSSTGCGRGAGGGRRSSRACWRRAVDTVIFFSIAFSAGLAFLAPGVDVAWANEAVPLLGRGPVAPLWMSLAIADFMVKLAHRAVRAGAISRRGGALPAAGLKIGLRFGRMLAPSRQPQPAKGGDPMSSETLEREAGFTRGGTA